MGGMMRETLVSVVPPTSVGDCEEATATSPKRTVPGGIVVVGSVATGTPTGGGHDCSRALTSARRRSIPLAAQSVPQKGPQPSTAWSAGGSESKSPLVAGSSGGTNDSSAAATSPSTGMASPGSQQSGSTP